jgi:hypothetical protein
MNFNLHRGDFSRMLDLSSMDEITSRVDGVIGRLFPEADLSTVHQILLEECSDKLPLVKNPEEIERIQPGILKPHTWHGVIGAMYLWRRALGMI